MISAVAFACVSDDGVAVSGIEFTPELKAGLGLASLGSMIRKPLDGDRLETEMRGADPVKQQLQRVHTTAARIRFPALSLKPSRSLGAITDILINYDCLGVCFHEFDAATPVPPVAISTIAPRFLPTARCSNNRPSGAGNDAARLLPPAGLVKKPQELLRYSRTFGRDRFLRVVSRYKIRAVMLVEPPDAARESSVCLYTNPDTSDEIERAFQALSIALNA